MMFVDISAVTIYVRPGIMMPNMNGYRCAAGSSRTNERHLVQIQREKRRRLPAPGTPVTVQKWLDGSLHFLHNNKELLVEEIRQRPKKQEERALSA